MFQLKLSYNVAILIISAILVEARAPNRIINGENVKIEDHPAVVELINDKGSHRCGGILIGNKHVLTAAHCVSYMHEGILYLNEPSSRKVVVGSETLANKNTPYYSVSNIAVPKNWEGESDLENKGGDIAILTLENEIPVDMHEKIAKLSKSSPRTGTKGVILGWGRFESLSGLSQKLQKAKVTVIDSNLCKAHYDPYIPVDTFCALGDNASFCDGDSGGPYLNDNDEIIGVISYTPSSDCSGDSVDIFTDVFIYKNWIQQILNGEDSSDTRVF